MDCLRIICPNGHLGFAPLRVESFVRGVAARPDYIAADSGSDDVGPGPLGGDTSGDTGSNSRVDLYVQIIREIATKHRLARFNVGYFHSEVDKGSAAAANARRRNRGRSRRARAA